MLHQAVEAAKRTGRNRERSVRKRVKRNQKAELSVVYEDDYLLAVNKPSGMLVQIFKPSGSVLPSACPTCARISPRQYETA